MYQYWVSSVLPFFGSSDKGISNFYDFSP